MELDQIGLSQEISIEPDVALEQSLQAGYTLPTNWYTDPDFYRAELEQIFGRSWQFAGLKDQLAQPGDFLTVQAGRVPVLVARDQNGELRAFVNVCRHRGSELVTDVCGNRRSFQCRYHAWTYSLDGSLLAAPGSKDEPAFDISDFSLFPVKVDTWGRFVFVNVGPDAPTLASVLGELPSLVDRTGLRLDEIHGRERRTYRIEANWKIVIDNYLECYHCPVAHPAFCDLIDLNDYEVSEFEYFSTQGGPIRKSGARRPYPIDGVVEDGFYAYLWPNFTINIYPGPGNVSLNTFVPIDHRTTLAVYVFCFVQDISPEEVTGFVEFVDQVQREDTVLCERVQRGLDSGRFERGKLMLSKERTLRHFQKLVFREMVRH